MSGRSCGSGADPSRNFKKTMGMGACEGVARG